MTCLPASCPTTFCGWFDAGCGSPLHCGCAAGLECGVVQAGRCAVPRLCDSEGWCFENPLPQGHTIRGAWAATPTDVFWVGDNATVLRWNGERHVWAAPPGVRADVDFHGVHGRGPNDLLVVGTQGSIYAFDGTTWTREPLVGDYRSPLHAVWALPDGGAVAVGPDNNLYRRASTGLWDFESLTIGPIDLEDVTLGPDGLLYAIGTVRTSPPYGAIVREPGGGGTVWTRVARLPMLRGNSLWLAPDGGFFAAGRSDGGAGLGPGVVAQRQADGGWENIHSTSAELRVLRGRTADDYFAAGDDGVVLRVRGGTPSSTARGTAWSALAFDELGPMLEGSFGEVARYLEADGGLELRSAGARTPVVALCGEAPGALYAGSTGTPGCVGTTCSVTALRRRTDGGAWWASESVDLPDTSAATSCAVNLGFTFLAGDQSSLRIMTTGSSNFVDPRQSNLPATNSTGIWVPSLTRWWVTNATRPATGLPFVTRFTGALSNPTPVAVAYDGGGDLLTVIGGTASSGWAMGENGLVFSVDSSGALVPAPRLGNADFAFVTGAELLDGGSLVVAGTRPGAVYLLEDASGFQAKASVDGVLSAGWATPSGAMVVVGSEVPDGGQTRGRVFQRQAGPWAEVPFRGDEALRGVWAAASDAGVTVWVGGSGGRIWRRDP